MNKGHYDAQYYRFDFAETVIDEMIKEMNAAVPKEKSNDEIYEEWQKGNVL